MTHEPEFPDATLYILMRNDMQSMNAGKGMAQAAHAANDFVQRFGSMLTPGYEDWRMSGGGSFGTTIVLSVFGDASLRYYLENALALSLPAGIVLDETYPVTDGDVTHLVPVNTCGYVFAKDRNDNGGALIEGLELQL